MYHICRTCVLAQILATCCYSYGCSNLIAKGKSMLIELCKVSVGQTCGNYILHGWISLEISSYKTKWRKSCKIVQFLLIITSYELVHMSTVALK